MGERGAMIILKIIQYLAGLVLLGEGFFLASHYLGVVYDDLGYRAAGVLLVMVVVDIIGAFVCLADVILWKPKQ